MGNASPNDAATKALKIEAPETQRMSFAELRNLWGTIDLPTGIRVPQVRFAPIEDRIEGIDHRVGFENAKCPGVRR